MPGKDGRPVALVDVIHFADPWCWWSWGLEPVLSRLKEVHGDQINVVYRMGGITDDVSEWRREYDVVGDEALKAWVKESTSMTGMPADSGYYLKSGVKSTWPACVAFKAAQLQGEEVAERFLRRLMEVIALDSKNASTEDYLVGVGKEVGLDPERLRRDIRSDKTRSLFEHEKAEMDVSFLTLKYINRRTGKGVAVSNTFESGEHQSALEKTAGVTLERRVPVDILEYFERHQGATIFPKELSEVFGISDYDVEGRMKILSTGGLLERREFPFGAVGWRYSAKTSKSKMSVEEAKASHVGSSKEESQSEMNEVITKAVKGLYTQVANDPRKGYHFPLGREALKFVGYSKEIEKIPETALESFAGVGYPHAADAIKAGDTVLDIGSGSGTDVLFSSLRTGPKGKVFGLDITDAMIEKARANIEKMGAKNVKILKGDATEIPLDDASVDVVTSNGVLNLVPDKAKAFREIYRVLRPGGKIQISDIVVQSNVQKVCGLIPQLWADCIGGAAVESEYMKSIKEAGFGDAKVIKRLDYFASSPSENTKRLTKTFGAESVVIAGSKPRGK
ncbi:MAG: methyltransferase domain-containing protein [Thaumarchaeota archaeon]|nr:methyltransferase domain-containing protein [Nitrososphaerota archaeon]